MMQGFSSTSQISHLLLCPSLWLLVPGLCSHFHYCNIHLRSGLVSIIFEMRIQYFVCFVNPCDDIQMKFSAKIHHSKCELHTYWEESRAALLLYKFGQISTFLTCLAVAEGLMYTSKSEFTECLQHTQILDTN